MGKLIDIKEFMLFLLWYKEQNENGIFELSAQFKIYNIILEALCVALFGFMVCLFFRECKPLD